MLQRNLQLYERVCLERSERQYKADSLWHAQATKTQGGALQSLRQTRASRLQEETYSTVQGNHAAYIECYPIDAR